MTDLFGFGACRLGGLVVMCWFSLLWLKDAVGGLLILGKNKGVTQFKVV
jgi:hypothetical protein